MTRRSCRELSLSILPALAEQSGFNVVGLLATHADWDHLLGRYAFPEAPLGCAETTAGRLINEPGAASAPCASSTRSTTSSARGRCRCRAPSGCRCRGRSRSASGARAAAGGRAHRGRHGRLDPVGVRAGVRRLPVAGRDPDAARQGRGARVPGDARPARAAGRAGRSRRPRSRRADRRHARRRDPARGPRLPRGAARARRGREAAARAPDRRAAPDPRAQRERCEPARRRPAADRRALRGDATSA